jgi:hypothetical protein
MGSIKRAATTLCLAALVCVGDPFRPVKNPGLEMINMSGSFSLCGRCPCGFAKLTRSQCVQLAGPVRIYGPYYTRW